jgi:hypothetical protein
MSLPIFGIIDELDNKGVEYIVGIYAYLSYLYCISNLFLDTTYLHSYSVNT